MTADAGEPGPSASCGRTPASTEAEGVSCCHHEAGERDTPPSAAARTKEVFRYGFGTMLDDLAPWLAAGLVLSAVVAALVPEGWIGEHLGTGIVPLLAALLVSLPVYICATSSTPLAFALVAAGLTPGAALVMLLAGPATNTATIAWALKDLGARATVIYVATIAVVAVGVGWLFDRFLAGAVRLAESGAAHEHGPDGLWGWTLAISAGVFSLLLLVSLGRRVAGAVRRRGADGSGHEHAAGAEPAHSAS